MMQSNLLTEFGKRKSSTDFTVLTRTCELVPLATSVQMIKDIMSAFARKVVSHLEEGNVLQSAELSKTGVECLKNFWSLCSRQQNVVSSSQLFAKWHPELLEEITPLASVFIDLFISAFGYSENQSYRAKQLYSWLNFDLPDRAIKIALLEAEGHGKGGADIIGPLISHMLCRKFDGSSSADYLLHFLLLKKWQGLAVVSDLIEVSKSLKAPPMFLSWLRTYWRNADSYLTNGTDLKAASISQFLLDLDTDEVLEPLTDVLQMAIFPESNVDLAKDGGESGSLLFVVDKKGKEQLNEITTNKDEINGKINKEKDLSEANDDDDHDNRCHSVVETKQTSHSPEKASKRKPKTVTHDTEIRNDNVIGFLVDRGHGESFHDEDSKQKTSKRKRSIVADDNIVADENEDDGSDKETTPKRIKQCDDNDVNSDSEDGDDKKVEIDSHKVTRTLRPRNLATAVLKSKNILISDPVASSYFTSDKVSHGVDHEKIEIFETSTVAEGNKGDMKMTLLNSPIIEKKVRSSPRINSQSGKSSFLDEGIKGSLPKKSNPNQLNHVSKGLEAQKKNESPRNKKKGCDNLLIQKGNESPLNQKRNESPLKQKRSGSPLKKKH